MLGQVGHVLVGLVDNVMVGELGADALAAVSLGNGVFFLAMSIALGFSFSITPLAAEADGQKDYSKALSVLKNGVLLCLVVSAILYVLINVFQPYLHILKQPAQVVSLANPYLTIITYSIIPFSVFQAFKQFADGMSATKYAMYAAVLGNVLNVIFNYIFIYGKFGFPRLEVEGAALGTLLSRIFMLLFLVLFLVRSTNFSKYLKHFFNNFFELKVQKKLFTLGLPTALQMLFEFGIFTSSIFLSGKLSAEAQAANQIALNLASLTFMVVIGLGVTATIRVGNQLGEKNYKELIRIMRSVFLMVLIIQSIFALIFIVTRNYLPMFYIENQLVINLASTLLIVAAFFQLSDGFQVTVLGALRGLQDVNIPTFLLFIAYWCIGFPLSYVLGKPENLGATGIWIGLLAGLTFSSIFLYIRYRYLVYKK